MEPEEIDRKQFRKDVAHRIHKQRLIYGFTNKKLAQLLGISESYVYRIQSGKILPSLDLLERICIVFGVTYYYMIRGVIPTPDNTAEKRFQEEQYQFLNEKLTQEERDHMLDCLKKYVDEGELNNHN